MKTFIPLEKTADFNRRSLPFEADGGCHPETDPPLAEIPSSPRTVREQSSLTGFISWSGGKDSALACYDAMKSGKVEVAYLLNMLSEDGVHSRSHNLTAEMLKAQAAAMGVAMVQRSARWQKYEEEFKAALLKFKEEGLQAGVFGDIDLQEHRDWVERVCNDTGLSALLPLWQRTRESLMDEFISAGFKAIIVVTNREFMGKEWLGRTIDKEFVRDIRAKGGVDLCGEKGEYHTFVYDGPIFKRPVDFVMGKKVMKDKHWFLDVLPDLKGIEGSVAREEHR